MQPSERASRGGADHDRMPTLAATAAVHYSIAFHALVLVAVTIWLMLRQRPPR
jgi:hypothetical protein